MKSLGQIEQDNREAVALANNPRTVEDLCGWLESAADQHDEDDAIGRAASYLLAEWLNQRGSGDALTRDQFAAKLALILEDGI